MTDRRLLVVVPTYNEAQAIGPVLRRLRRATPWADVLVADDNSPDGTGALADRLAAADGAVHVLHRPVKEGLGPAYIAGFRWGLERGYAAIAEMDADGSHQPEELPRLLAALDRAGLVLGSRYVPGGRVVNWPRRRQVLSRGGNAYVRWALGLPLRDATSGYRVFRRQVLEALPLHDVASAGYCFQVDMAWRAYRLGFRVLEVPITFVERTQGASKMDNRIVREALARTTVWALRHRLGQARAALGCGPVARPAREG